MDQKNFAFRYPPPPPPNYIPTIMPPLPTDSPPVDQPPPPPPPTTVQNWTNWSVDFSRPPPPVYNGLTTVNATNALNLAYNLRNSSVSPSSISTASSTDSSGYYGSSIDSSMQYLAADNRQYRTRYNSDQYSSNQGWSQKNNFKRPRYENRLDQRNDSYDNYNKYSDPKYARNLSNLDSRYTRDPNHAELKNNKNTEEGPRSRKRKKPLSQSIPAKRAWTDEDAQMAIDVEKEYNKLFKNHSLKIKFPDQELNRDIVSKFHPSIETVYFQQPSNARFCFVTLTEGTDPAGVIEQLNVTPFGDGFLTAEYKKDREEEQVVGPEDIDPLTLYVGNLAQEVTKEDMVTFFPKNKRIDIGFAKKMRYTRYAFVSFKNVQDSIEAFKTTHYADLHSKSMIVRFRRLHGTVGMPGEAKSHHPTKENQQPEKKKEEDQSIEKVPTDYSDSSSRINEHEDSEIYSPSTSYDPPSSSSPSHSPNPNNCDRRTTSECSEVSSFDPGLVKSEPYDFSYEEFEECQVDKTEVQFNDQKDVLEDTKVPDLSAENSQNVTLEPVVKKEPEFITPFLPEIPDSMFPIRPIPLKEEPNDNNEADSTVSAAQGVNEEIALPNGLKEPKVENENAEPVDPEDNEEEFNTTTDFGSVLDSLKRRPFMP